MPASASVLTPADERVAERRGAMAAAGIPLGRRASKGRLSWYLVQVPQGRERFVCEQLRRVVSADVLEGAFVAGVERWIKRGGVWSTEVRPLYERYVFAATRDVTALDKALGRVTFPAQLVGSQGRFFSPVDEGVLSWLASVMDAGHVVRSSIAVIEGGMLRVTAGPLVGHEASVVKIDRHRRSCMVRVGGRDGTSTVTLPLCVPRKS